MAAECRELLGPHTDTYFQASAFLRLARDEGACVPLPTLFHYLALRSRQLQLVRRWCCFYRGDGGKEARVYVGWGGLGALCVYPQSLAVRCTAYPSVLSPLARPQRLQLGSLDPGLSGALGPPQLAQFLSQACPARALAAMGAAAADWQTVAAQRLWLQHGRRGRCATARGCWRGWVGELPKTYINYGAT